jgi:hypothetical protein
MSKIVRKIRIDLKEYDDTWKNSYILIAMKGFRDAMDFKQVNIKFTREDYRLTRELKRVQSQLDSDATFGKESSPELLAKEEALLKEAEKTSQDLLKTFQKFVVERFISGSIYDNETKTDREMTKEDILEFDEQIIDEIVQSALGTLPKKN